MTTKKISFSHTNRIFVTLYLAMMTKSHIVSLITSNLLSVVIISKFFRYL